MEVLISFLLQSNTRYIFTIHKTFKRSLLEDLEEHQSRWEETILDDTAEGHPNFLTPYRLVSLASEVVTFSQA